MKMKKLGFSFSLLFALVIFSACPEKERMAVISTDHGDIKIKLYNETPKHRDNFVKLADEKYFDGTLFHRVIKGFMIQGGDPDSKNSPAGAPLGQGGPGYTVPAEFIPTLYHKRGALCAARKGDPVNPEKASSGSQFYIVQGKPIGNVELTNIAKQTGVTYTEEMKEVYAKDGGTPFLDGSYTVFGEVVEGMEVVDKITAVQADQRSRPTKDIKMTVKMTN